MFHTPVLHVENIHPGTRVGIEIEICIKKEKYDKIIFKKDNPSSYSNNLEKYYEFDHGNPFKAGVDDHLDKIILTVDLNGKTVLEAVKNIVLFDIYESGKVYKRIRK